MVHQVVQQTEQDTTNMSHSIYEQQMDGERYTSEPKMAEEIFPIPIPVVYS